MGFAGNNRGFTLVEIAVSVAILSLLLVGIAAMLGTSIRADTYNQERHIADRLAQGLAERILDFAAQGAANNFADLIDNDFAGGMPHQDAIPGLRQAIPNEPANDRIYDDFDGDGVVDYGQGSKNIYVYQMLIDDIQVGTRTDLLKEVTIRIYYAVQNAGPAQVDLARHADPGGAMPRRFGSPLAEVCTYISRP